MSHATTTLCDRPDCIKESEMSNPGTYVVEQLQWQNASNTDCVVCTYVLSQQNSED